MSTARFTNQVRFVNQLLLPREYYPEIQVPSDVTVYDAIPKTMAEMVNISLDRRRRYAYTTESNFDRFSFPAGYTRSDLEVRFVDFDRQWRLERGSWRYRGGTICLELTLAVYADRRAVDKPRCWAMILEHELLHTRDEIEIVRNFLPRTLTNSAIVRGFLQAPIAENEFDQLIRGGGDGRGSTFEQRIQRSIWVPESSRRAAELHRQRPNDGTSIRDCINAD